MARDYLKEDAMTILALRRHNVSTVTLAIITAAIVYFSTPLSVNVSVGGFLVIAGLIPMIACMVYFATTSSYLWIESERKKESARRGGKPVLGLPPDRNAFEDALVDARKRGKKMLDRYMVGFELDSGKPIWVTDDEICGHGCVFAKTGVGKTLWLEGLMFQQMARGRASGFTFIDAKRDPGTLADIIIMALITGRIEDLVVVDPFDPVCAYNFVFTTQRADVKARKVLRCGLPPTSDQSTTKHYDRLAADAVYRVVRAMESLGLAWSVRDIAVALSAFNIAYPRIRALLHDSGNKNAMVELGHLAGTYRTAKGSLDSARLTDNLRGIASELHSISNSEAGEMFCVPRAELSLTDAILRGKFVYYMLPRLEEAESAARMVKVFREDLEVSIGEVTSSRVHSLEDPHMVIIDEGASTFGPTWANLFELARKGRFALLFGAQSVGGLMDAAMGLSEQFYERVLANVNLKVIMRIGDNRTAMDMSEWIGKVTTTKTSVSSAISSGISAGELTKNIELNRRSSDSFRDALTVADDEEDLVSPEELKHEMSAEKGLAWFDKGDGRLRKGRAIWFDAMIPATWEGREFLTRYESVEADEIGLAEWVDEEVLTTEIGDEERENPGGGGGQSPHNAPHAAAKAPAQQGPRLETLPPGMEKKPDEKEEDDGPFRLSLFKGFRGMGRSRTMVVAGEDLPPGMEKKQEAKSKPTPAAAPPAKPSPSATPPSPAAAEPAAAQPKNAANEPNFTNNPPQQGADGASIGGGKKRKRKRKSKQSGAGNDSKFMLSGRGADVVTKKDKPDN